MLNTSLARRELRAVLLGLALEGAAPVAQGRAVLHK